MKEVHWIPEGGVGVVIKQNGEEPTFKEMQDFCGGFLEHVTVLYAGKRAHMYVHEEGRMFFHKRNELATDIYFAASIARGINPDSAEDRARDLAEYAEKFGGAKVIDLTEADGKPQGIYGPAVLIVGYPEPI